MCFYKDMREKNKLAIFKRRMVRNRGRKGGNWLQMLFWCCQDLKTAELLCPPVGDMKDWDAILCLNSVQEMLIDKVKIHIRRGKVWTWVASTRTGIDSSPKAVGAGSQRIKTICFKDKFLSPGAGCFSPSHPLTLSLLSRGWRRYSRGFQEPASPSFWW